MTAPKDVKRPVKAAASAKRQVSAKKTKAVKKRNGIQPPGYWKIIRNVCGIIFAFFAIYTLIAIVSYMFTWDADQSLLASSADGAAKNSGGRLGLRWAKFLVTDMFGIGAFAVVIVFGAAALMCLRKRVRFVRTLLTAFVGAVLLSLVSAFVAGLFGGSNAFGDGIGGAYGTAVVDEMNSMMGSFGTLAVLVLVAILFLLFSNKRFVSWFSSLGEKKGSAEAEAGDDSEAAGVSGCGEECGGNDPAANDDAADDRSVDDCIDDDVENDNHSGEDDENGEDDEDDEEARDSRHVLEVVELHGNGSSFGHDDDEVNNAGADGEDEGRDTDVANRDQDVANHDDGLPELTVEGIGISTGEDVPDGGVSQKYDPRLDLPHYKFPGLELLNDYSDKWYDVSQAELQRNNMKITAALAEYKIQIQSVSARKGPTVTLYEIVPAPGTKVAQIKRVEEDIARSIGVKGVRVITLLNTIGIEVPNDKPSIVPMKSILNDPLFRNNKYELPIALGYTISQKVLAFDLTKAPHLLVAGATGMGKSVGLNVILTSLLYSKHPSELKLVLVDPKRVELSIYGAIKNHFLATLPGEDKPILTDTSKVVSTLKSLCVEMESRYELLEMAKERNIKDYNARFLDRKLNPNKGHKFLPYIVVVIDEFADLLITAGKEIEEPISRLAAKARAIGIHLIIATQRPTTDVITGTIKANFPSRVAFKVMAGVDSKTIIDEVGANKLIGRGDMLVMIAGEELSRVQCAFIDTDEAIRISEFIGSQQGYGCPYYLPECEDDEEGVSAVDLGKRDALFEEAAKLIVANQQGSTSLIQRKMEIGYNRAGRIIDQLEAAGVVGPFEGSKARKVLIQDFDQLDELLRHLN